MTFEIRPLWVLGAVAAFGAVFGTSELLLRAGLRPESTRRVAHAAGAAGAAGVQLALTLSELAVLAVVFTAFLIGTRASGGLRSIHGVSRRTAGAQLLPVGLLLAAVVVWRHPAATAFGMLILAFADPAAAITGRLGGPAWRVPGSRKSLGGSAAFMAVATGLGLLFTIVEGHPRPATAVAIAAGITLAEATAGFGLDNVLVPALGALAGRAWLGL